jgi:hypothetical protein
MHVRIYLILPGRCTGELAEMGRKEKAITLAPGAIREADQSRTRSTIALSDGSMLESITCRPLGEGRLWYGNGRNV